MRVTPGIRSAALLGALPCMILLCAGRQARADVKLGQPFSSHMVLQREMSVPVWGTAAPGESVTVAFRGQSKSAAAGADGKWKVSLDATAAGGPFDMSVKGRNTLLLNDVMVGEVWIGGGQSNMEAILSFFAGPNLDTVKSANYPNLRLMTFAGSKQWAACTPASASGFSCTGFYYGRDLHLALNVPVGMLVSAIGGTDIERWLDPASIAADPLIAKDTAAGTLYDKYIAPLAPFACRGIVWYQGENNASDPYAAHPQWSAPHYRGRFQALIQGWRKAWGRGEELPFHFVQLANYMAAQTAPGENSAWAQIREGQRLGLSQPNTEMAVAIDIGEAGNVHPKDKWDVGRRLTLIAMAKQYGSSGLVYSGPAYQSMTVQGSTAKLAFRYAQGLAARSGKLSGFEVAGADGKWQFADASVHGDSVWASNASVAAPVKVRYGWANNPNCNLVNGAGLPASPFQTEGPQLPTPLASPRKASEAKGNRTLRYPPADASGRALKARSGRRPTPAYPR
jgi:sialate O-acetylesterase